jgi:hypothetical protein
MVERVRVPTLRVGRDGAVGMPYDAEVIELRHG